MPASVVVAVSQQNGVGLCDESDEVALTTRSVKSDKPDVLDRGGSSINCADLSKHKRILKRQATSRWEIGQGKASKPTIADYARRVETPGHTVRTHMSSPADSCESQAAITAYLLDKYGPLLGRDALIAVLGFPSGDAFDRYCQRGHLELDLVDLPHRRGTFALATNVAKYLVARNAPVRDEPNNEVKREVDR